MNNIIPIILKEELLSFEIDQKDGLEYGQVKVMFDPINDVTSENARVIRGGSVIGSTEVREMLVKLSNIEDVTTEDNLERVVK